MVRQIRRSAGIAEAGVTLARASSLAPPRRAESIDLDMIPIPTPKFVPGEKVRVVQFVRVGHRRWKTQFEGIVEREGRRPVGGIEMGGKASACHQPTIQLRKSDGEITVVTLDDNTEVEVIAPAAG